MSNLKRGEKKIFEWLQQRIAGEIHDEATVLAASGWGKVSLDTYMRKNKLAPFLLKRGDRYNVLMDGSDITEQYFHEVFTQTAPRKVALSVGNSLLAHSGATYELVQPIGRGAVGQVWEAKQSPSNPLQLVAVKLMMPREDLLAESKVANVRARFRREAAGGSKLSCPNVIKYLDSGDVQGNPFLVMEIAECSVAQKLRKEGAFAEADAQDVIEGCLLGLAYLHARGLSHRDIKPANILSIGSQYKVGDLGIVSWGDFDAAFTQGGTITRSSVQLGSWFYMAPEQQEDPHDAVPASDIYALGVTWIEMLLGKAPSPQAIAAGAYPDLPATEATRQIIRRMVSYRVGDRPTLLEVRTALGLPDDTAMVG